MLRPYLVICVNRGLLVSFFIGQYGEWTYKKPSPRFCEVVQSNAVFY